MKPKSKYFLLVSLLGLMPVGVAAQSLEDIGPRAPAMGAFVAVADDASAVVWNPSGLVFGPFFNLTIDLGRSRSRTAPAPGVAAEAAQQRATLIALALPPFGVSYTRFSTLAAAAPSPAVGGMPDREEGQVLLRSVVTSALGATVLQSIGDYVTVGATVKVVNGGEGRAIGTADSWDEGFDLAGRLERRGSTKVDADLGAMLAVGRLRAGVVVRNVSEPDFAGDGGPELTVPRHARVGLAWGNRWPGRSETLVAVDADVTRVLAVGGDRRDVAVGAERSVLAQKVSLRAGVRASTIGEARPVITAGVSYAVRAGIFVDGFVGGGANDARRWGIGGRVAY